MTLLHLSPNVITLGSLLHLRAVITFKSSTPWLWSIKYYTGGASNKHNQYQFAYPQEVEKTTIFYRFMLSQVIH